MPTQDVIPAKALFELKKLLRNADEDTELSRKVKMLTNSGESGDPRLKGLNEAG